MLLRGRAFLLPLLDTRRVHPIHELAIEQTFEQESCNDFLPHEAGKVSGEQSVGGDTYQGRMMGWGHGAGGGWMGEGAWGAVMTDLGGELVDPQVEVVLGLTDGQDGVDERT